MATPGPSDIVGFGKYRILLKEEWMTGSTPGNWQAVESIEQLGGDYLDALRASEVVAPQVGQAEFLWRSGSIKRTGSSDFTLVNPVSLDDWFVRIDKIDGALRVPLWIGRMTGDTREFLGSDRAETVNQTLLALGLEHLLDRVTIAAGWVSNDGTAEVEIDTPPVFNEHMVYGFKTVGNRSAEKIAKPESEGGDRYAFSSEDDVWSNRDIVEYLLAHYTPGDVRFVLSGATSDLDAISLPRVDLRGMTVREALNFLIDRRRGLGWRVKYTSSSPASLEADGDVVNVHVFTTIDSNVTIPADMHTEEVILRANSDLQSFDADRLDVDPLVSVQDTLSSFGRIRVLGERVKACYSVKYSDSTLIKGWTDAEETAYEDAPGSTAQERDNERTKDEYRHVYRTFLIELNTGEAATAKARNPTITDDGEIDTDHAAPIRTWPHARTLLPTLPLPKQWTKSGVKPEYREMFALVKHPVVTGSGSTTTSIYGYIDKIAGINTPSGHVRPLDNQLGLRVEISPGHALGLNHFSNSGLGTSKSSLHLPSYDYTTLVATVAQENDERLKYVVSIDGADASRELVIEVEDAQLWWIARDTITDVSGTSVATFSPTDLTADYPVGCILRNDIDRLKRVAVLAKAWYGRNRAAVRLVVKELYTSLPAGCFLESIENPLSSRDVGSIVSSREWDFTNSQTAITTSFAEIEFSRFR